MLYSEYKTAFIKITVAESNDAPQRYLSHRQA